MHILISNDDGYDAIGLKALIGAMQGLGKITVVAPSKNCSGASSSLTLEKDIKVEDMGNNHYVVNRTPTDCAHLAMTADFISTPPDIFVSGINNRGNMGDDTIYSGTVAVAIEGHLFGIPAFAFSLAPLKNNLSRHFDTAAKVARTLIQRYLKHPPQANFLFNVNIPDVEESEIQGYKIARLGRRHPADSSILKSRQGNVSVYRIGEAGEISDGGFGTDFDALANKYVSITPLMVDLTDYGRMGDAEEWLAQ